jgi:hypothetical protein
MNTPTQTLLVASNLILAAAVSFHVLKFVPPATNPVQHPGVPQVIQIPQSPLPLTLDLQPLLKPITALEQSIAHLSLALQQSTTSSAQYDYLQKEVERLETIDKTLADRIATEKSRAPKAQSPSTTADLAKFKSLQDQVQQELKRRRETISKLISRLEIQLDSKPSAPRPQPPPADHLGSRPLVANGAGPSKPEPSATSATPSGATPPLPAQAPVSAPRHP